MQTTENEALNKKSRETRGEGPKSLSTKVQIDRGAGKAPPLLSATVGRARLCSQLCRQLCSRLTRGTKERVFSGSICLEGVLKERKCGCACPVARRRGKTPGWNRVRTCCTDGKIENENMENVPRKDQTVVAKLARDARRSESPLSRGVLLFF